MTDWLLYTHPALPLRWRYPAVTPLGCAVDVLAEDRGNVTRVHLTSRGSAEVYFEVRRLPGLTAEDEYAAHIAGLAQRFAAKNFSASPLAAASLGGRPAHAYSFLWGENERAVVVVKEAGALYRIIYDPRSRLNAALLATVELETQTGG